MDQSHKKFSAREFLVGMSGRFGSVLDIPYMLPCDWKPDIKVIIGKAWKKQAKNGREYYKMKFDAFRTPSGKALYAQAWSRIKEPREYDVYCDEKDVPVINLCPLLGREPIQPSFSGIW